MPTKTFMTQRRPSPGCGYMSASGEIPVIVLTRAIHILRKSSILLASPYAHSIILFSDKLCPLFCL